MMIDCLLYSKGCSFSSFFDNISLSTDIVNGLKTLIGYLYALDDFINVTLLFSLFLAFIGLLFLGLLAHVIISLIRS